MKRTKALLTAALGLAVLVILAGLVVPGALADRDEPVRPAHLDYRESNVQAGAVTGETVTLHVESRLGHRGGPATNVSLELRAIDTDSELLVDRARTDLGTVAGEREYNTTTALTVPRDGEYEIETIVYVDGERRSRTVQTVSGVGTLIPEYARTNVAFSSFPATTANVPPIVYTVDRVDGDRATLDVTPFLTNTGDDPEDDLELVVLARQTDSNIVADRATAPVGAIQPGQTAEPTVQVTVPDEYNYQLDAMLRRDGVVVATASAPASLDPTETVPENQTQRDTGLETSDFEEEAETPRSTPTEEPDHGTDGADGPGFGVAAAILAVLGGTILYARRSR